MSEQKHLLVEVRTHDEHMTGAVFALVNPAVADLAKKYMAEIASMKAKGLNPYKISEFCYAATWLKELPMISPKLANQIDVICDDGTVAVEEALEEASCESLPVMNTIEELEQYDGAGDDVWDWIRTECDTVNVSEDDFTMKAIIKHTDVYMETLSIDDKSSQPLHECDFYTEFYTEEENV